MSFVLEKAIFVNRAPFEYLDLDFKGKGVNVLTAINGKGKTTILSYIVDSFYELAKHRYNNEFEGIENKYYRISSPFSCLDREKVSIVYLRYKKDDEIWDYVDIRNRCAEEEYERLIPLEEKITYSKLLDSMVQNNDMKKWSKDVRNSKNIETIFSENVLTFFPAYRYEIPSYLNDPYSKKIEYKKKSLYSGDLPNPIEVLSGLSGISNWLMDVIVDWYVNPHVIENKYDLTPEKVNIWDKINLILKSTLSTKFKTQNVRFGIGRRNYGSQRISIMEDLHPEHSKSICSLFDLSSGELSLLIMFCEILRQADNLNPNIVLWEIKGIVLIDEIDKHLHITLQKEILPKLLQLFPNVQFIVSSHSPFLNMGLAEILPENSQIMDLDNEGLIYNLERNEEFQKVYEQMISENNRYAQKYNNLKIEIEKITKPLVITEGKTDIKHILKAKEQLGVNDIDFETISEEHQPDGDDTIFDILKSLSKIKNEKKIIGIFDRDKDSIIKKIAPDKIPYLSLGNKVYAFCIDSPQCRKNAGQEKISIEYLYSDEEIHSKIDGRQLFFGSEFSDKTGRHKKENKLSICNQSERGKDKIIESMGGQAVYDENENNVLTTKDDFANAVKNGNIVISQDSWENFRHIFEKLKNIIDNTSDE